MEQLTRHESADNQKDFRHDINSIHILMLYKPLLRGGQEIIKLQREIVDIKNSRN